MLRIAKNLKLPDEARPNRRMTPPIDSKGAGIKVLNLYAGIGGNRKLWEDVEVTAVESEQYIADAYKQLFPDDEVVVADAHQYLLDHFQEFDFIWSSPPCPTHSKLVTAKRGWGIYEYPDMKLYQEIIFLKHTFKGLWVVENVEPYYNVLLMPTMWLGRHYFWSNFHIPRKTMIKPHKGNLSHNRKEELAEGLDIELPVGTKDQRKLLRNAVDPKMGLYIFNAAQATLKQEILL